MFVIEIGRIPVFATLIQIASMSGKSPTGIMLVIFIDNLLINGSLYCFTAITTAIAVIKDPAVVPIAPKAFQKVFQSKIITLFKYIYNNWKQ